MAAGIWLTSAGVRNSIIISSSMATTRLSDSVYPLLERPPSSVKQHFDLSIVEKIKRQVTYSVFMIINAHHPLLAQIGLSENAHEHTNYMESTLELYL